MNRYRKEDSPPKKFTPTMVHRNRYVLFGCLLVIWLFVPVVLADDCGLANPAEKEFIDFKSETKKTESFAKKSPAFNDRSVPNPQKAETIRQVSADESAGDPFPVVSQPFATQEPVFDWEYTAPAIPNNPLLTQNNVIPYDPNINAGGYVNPYAMQNMYQTGMETGYLPQFAQYPQQEYAMTGVNPQMNPYANLYTPYGYVADPYGMSGYQDAPDYQSLYQTLLLQEMTRRQAEEAQESANSEKRQNANEDKKPSDTQWTLNNLVPVRVSSPLGETLFACAKTVSPFCTPTGPDKGVGMPLVNKSWLDHPWYFGGFVGSIFGSELVSQMIKQKSGGTGGFICGYNFNEYWGLESRLHFSSIDIYDTDYARQLFADSYQAQFGTEAPMLTTRTNELTVLDAAVHYYPLGNAKWRPYFKYGLGLGHECFINTFGYKCTADVVTMPLGVGMRYWWNERIAIQADLIDNVVFASGIAKTQNNIAFTIGLTYSFGSSNKRHPVHYWPATPSMGSKW